MTENAQLSQSSWPQAGRLSKATYFISNYAN